MRTQAYSDFSGGYTDKTLPGQHNRYAVADNLLIDADLKLFTRLGFDIFSTTGYQLVANTRVARLINYDFDSDVLAVQNTKVNYLNAGVWTALAGPAVQAFPNNTASSLVEEAQWRKHVFLASDNGTDPVVKAYKDGATWKLRTAGLPKPVVDYTYFTDAAGTVSDDAAKKAAAVTLANDIKNTLKTHVNDYGVAPAAHIAKHVAVYNALNAMADLTGADSIATICTRANDLRDNYNLHVDDARLSLASQVYHAQAANLTTPTEYVKDSIINLRTETSLPDSGHTDTIDEAIRVLNDIRNKYNWHIYAPLTHNNATATSAAWGAYPVTTAAIVIDATLPTPILNGSLNTFLNYVNLLKAEYNAHAAAAGTNQDFFFHLLADSSNYIRHADATDLCSATSLLACTYHHYAMHYEAANRRLPYGTGTPRGFYGATEQYTQIYSGTAGAGSPVIGTVSPDPVANNLPIGYYMVKQTSDVVAPLTGWMNPQSVFPVAALAVTARAAGPNSITMTANSAVAGPTTCSFAFHWNGIHVDIERDSAAKLNSAQAGVLFRELYDPLLSNLTSLASLATTIAGYIKAHTKSGYTVLSLTSLADSGTNFLGADYSIPDMTYYLPNSNFSGSSEYLAPHQSYNNSTLYWPTTYNAFPRGMPATYFDEALTTATYLYRYVHKYAYTIGSTSYLDVSAPSEPMSITTFVSPASYTSGDTTWQSGITISGIPTLANTGSTNYDTANITVEFYRTIANGSNYFLVNSFTNGGSSSFTDYLDDTTLLTKEGLYTNGGIVANSAPPIASLIHQMDDRMYYAVGNRVYQSITSDPDSVPTEFFDEIEETVTAISSTKSNLIVFGNLNVYRMEGVFDDLGNGFMRHERIFDRTGCVAQQSCVKVDNGLFFAGKDGFYYTDGFQCMRVTDFEDTFIGYTATSGQRAAIQGTYDHVHKKIYWTIKTSSGLSQPDRVIVLDLQFGIKKDVTPSTYFTGGFDGYTGFNPTALMWYNNRLHYGDQDGYIFVQNPGTYMDLKKDTSVVATSWVKRAMLWDFKTCHSDYGTPNFKKYYTRLNVEFEQITNLSVQVRSDSDKGRKISDLPIIRSRKLLDWGDSKIDWTSSVYTAKDGGVIDEFRRFKADGSLRSNYRAIELRNAYCVVVASNIMGNIDVANVAGTVWTCTLLGSPTFKWPLYSVGYFIRLGGVDYPVTVRTSDSVVRVDTAGLTSLTARSNVPWEMWGYPKNEATKLINLDVNFELLGQQQKDYQGNTSTDGGENSVDP